MKAADKVTMAGGLGQGEGSAPVKLHEVHERRELTCTDAELVAHGTEAEDDVEILADLQMTVDLAHIQQPLLSVIWPNLGLPSGS